MRPLGPFARSALAGSHRDVAIYRLEQLEADGVATGIDRLPCTIKILLEAAMRHAASGTTSVVDVENIASWRRIDSQRADVPFLPSRVLLQDFTGVPALVDLAALRGAAARIGIDPRRVEPVLPVDLVVDHSVQVDHWGTAEALAKNRALETSRNRERFRFMRWGASAFENVRIVPPSMGIVHQVNLELLASVVAIQRDGVAAPDSMIGTDSHTTMVGALGVLGWGVGGIEAEAIMLGQPYTLVLPDVVGVRLRGRLRGGVNATDLVLALTQRLRKHGVVDKMVEVTGEGLDTLPLEDRATVANMAPEYGATCAFFPVDAETLAYLARTGRSRESIALVEAYTKEQGLFRSAETREPSFSEVLDVDLDAIEPSVAGPKRPHDRLVLSRVAADLAASLPLPMGAGGFDVAQPSAEIDVAIDGETLQLGHGAIAIAAITSCTSTSNPAMMLAAGLVARNAVARGLRVSPHVKASLAPGSRSVSDYLRGADLLAPLEALGFHLVGYGCTSCNGNSGPLSDPMTRAVTEDGLVAAAVVSGNRNFEGRVHPLVRASYLASPPLVVAYALAGTVLKDLTRDPLGHAPDGTPVFMRDLWPTHQEIAALVSAIPKELFARAYDGVFRGDALWNEVDSEAGAAAAWPAEALFAWDPASTYIREPPYFDPASSRARARELDGARVLAVLGDSITTDHISPVGAIAEGSPAGDYLARRGVRRADFNTYGTRRGNHEVMLRGTFANVRLKNALVPGVEGGITRHLPSGEAMSIFDAAERYRAEGVPLVILAGKDYGAGSSRDWAAKGQRLLGVRAVIAESFERIHRANLVGMGVAPLELAKGATRATLGLTGEERITIRGLEGALRPRMKLEARAVREDGTEVAFDVVLRVDTALELSSFEHGGLLPAMLARLQHLEQVQRPAVAKAPETSTSSRNGEITCNHVA